ncbi:MAG TPA: hypothetical protein VGL46_05110 [Pseudonocardiaceae bacterium]
MITHATLERTSRRIVWGTWGCAAIVMVASAANAALTYGALGDNRALGLATGVAVDIGLCVALIGDRQLYVHGLSSHWGRVLRITTAAMSLILNTGIAVRDGHYFLALMHAFLPILLVVLTEYGQDVLLQFAALAQAEHANTPLDYSGGPAGRADTVLPGRDSLGNSVPLSRPGPNNVEPIHPLDSPGSGVERRNAGPLVVAGPLPVPDRTVVPVVRSGAGQPVATNGATEPATTQPPQRDKPRDKTATAGATKRATRARQAKPATAEQRRAWVRQQRDSGRTVTGADVHKQFADAPRDGARIVRQVDAELEAELRAVAAGER